ncbi:PAS domain S-box protein [bacterium]|nr:PAS domain S-box protein [bacterium]
MNSEYTSLEDLKQVFDTLASCMTEALIVVNTKGQFVMVNLSAIEMFGLEEEPNKPEMAKYYGAFHLDEKTFYKKEELPSYRALNGENVKDEIIFIRNSKKPNGVYACANAKPILNSGKEIIGAVIVATNITEQKKRETEIQRNKDLLEQSQQMAQIGYWEIDLIQNTLEWSKETKIIHEVGSDFIPDLETGINFYDEDSKPIITKLVEDGIIKNKSWDIKLGIITAKGNHKWVRSIGRPYIGKQGVEKVVGVFQDITKDKLAEDQLIKNEKEIKKLNAQLEEKIELRTKELSKTKQDYQKLYNEAPDMMASIDTSKLTIIDCNQTVCDYLGYSKEELINQSFLNLYHSESYSIVKKAIQQFKKDGEIKNQRLYLKKKNGEKLPVTLNTSAIKDASGNIIQANSIWRDITQLEKVEKELKFLNNELENRVLKRTEELQKVNEELEEFAYMTTHDLKSPISNIRGHIEILELEMNTSSNPVIGQSIHWMKDSIEKAESNIQSIIKVAQIREPASSITTDVSLNKIIKQVIEDINFEKAKISISTDRDYRISFNEKNIYSIIQNLISNSIKYKKSDTTAVINIKVFDNNEYTCVSISDNGLGINLDMNQANLFGMFKRLHDHVEGSGIGLYLVKRMLDAAGGKIEVESKLNEGSTFTVFFKK